MTKAHTDKRKSLAFTGLSTYNFVSLSLYITGRDDFLTNFFIILIIQPCHLFMLWASIFYM